MDQDKINQLKNYLWEHFILVRTAPVTRKGEDYGWIIPPPIPGEESGDWELRMEKAVSRAKIAVSVENGIELKKMAGTMVDLLVEILIQPLEEKHASDVREWAKIKEKVDGLAEDKKRKIIVPSTQEIQDLGN